MTSEFDISRLDITKQNAAVEKVLEHTDDPRHRYLLQSYLRHRYLESAGRWEEILDPSLTVDVPHYRFSLRGQEPFSLQGKDQVGMLYGHWTATISACSRSRTRAWPSATTWSSVAASPTSRRSEPSWRPPAWTPTPRRCTSRSPRS